MARRRKYNKIHVLYPTSRGTTKVRNIVDTFLEGIPHIKKSRYIIISDSKYTYRVLSEIYWSMAGRGVQPFYIEDYYYYCSNGYYYQFIQRTINEDDIIGLTRNELNKLVWV